MNFPYKSKGTKWETEWAEEKELYPYMLLLGVAFIWHCFVDYKYCCQDHTYISL